jgi:two-component system, chemotaxis family, chemotaxis protein CheY
MDKDILILVVDDNSIMRTIISDILEHAGYSKLIMESDGARALQIVKSRKIDLIISDWQMHGMKGIEFLKKVREDDQAGKTPFIMVTVEGTKESRKTADQYGVSGFISKPFHGEDLLREIRKVMSKSFSGHPRLLGDDDSSWGDKAFRVIQEDSARDEETGNWLKLHLSSQAGLFLNHLPPVEFHQIMMKILSLRQNPLPGDARELTGYPFLRNDAGEYRIIYDIQKNTLRIILIRKRR